MPYLTGQVITQADLAALFTSGTYTPTLGNLAIGTGGTPVNSAKYTFVGFPAGGVLTVEGRIKFGTSSVTLPAGSDETISLPSGYSIIETGVLEPVCQINYIDDSTGAYVRGGLLVNSATTVKFVLWPIVATYETLTVLTATTPFTWAINDSIVYRFVCRCTGP
jgi:hypothetical protein